MCREKVWRCFELLRFPRKASLWETQKYLKRKYFRTKKFRQKIARSSFPRDENLIFFPQNSFFPSRWNFLHENCISSIVNNLLIYLEHITWFITFTTNLFTRFPWRSVAILASCSKASRRRNISNMINCTRIEIRNINFYSSDIEKTRRERETNGSDVSRYCFPLHWFTSDRIYCLLIFSVCQGTVRSTLISLRYLYLLLTDSKNPLSHKFANKIMLLLTRCWIGNVRWCLLIGKA